MACKLYKTIFRKKVQINIHQWTIETSERYGEVDCYMFSFPWVHEYNRTYVDRMSSGPLTRYDTAEQAIKGAEKYLKEHLNSGQWDMYTILKCQRDFDRRIFQLF